MSVKRTVLSIAKLKGVTAKEMAGVMDYSRVQSFYRALNSSKAISFGRIESLAKLLGIPLCELINIFKSK